jgi:hypothetical protein
MMAASAARMDIMLLAVAVVLALRVAMPILLFTRVDMVVMVALMILAE